MNNSLKILLVCGSYGGGGAERVALNLGSTLCAQGNSVAFYYWDEKGGQTYSIDPRIQLRKAPGRQLFARIFGLKKLLKMEPVDLIIGFTDMPNIVAYGALFGQWRGPVFITTIHSDLRIRDENVGLSWKTSLLKLLHRRACVFAKKVVVVSDGAKESLIDYYRLPRSNVMRIYNPVLEKVSASACRYGIVPPLKMVAAGRLTQQKNYPLMVRAVKLLVEKYNIPSHLSIYGEGELRMQLQVLIDQLGMNSIITLHGFVPDLTAKLAENDVFLMSSTWEGFGNVLVEALDAGLRIVSTDCPSGPKEILANGKYGNLVPMDDAEQIAQAIVALTENSAMQNSAELRQHLHQFTNAYVAREYSKLISSIVSK